MKNFIQRFFSDKSGKTQTKMNEINGAFFCEVKSRMRQVTAKRKGYEPIDLNSSYSSNYDYDEDSDEDSKRTNSKPPSLSDHNMNHRIEIISQPIPHEKSPNSICINEVNIKQLTFDKKSDEIENFESSKYKINITSNNNYKYDQQNENLNFNLNFSQIEMKLKEKHYDLKRMSNNNDDSSSISSISSCSSISPNITANTTSKHIPLINISPPPSSKSSRSTAIVINNN
jgi:hypothetical protein